MNPIPLIDTHAHLGSEAFNQDLPEVLERARREGVKGIIAVGETLKDAMKNLELARCHSMILPAAGLFPSLLDIAQAKKLHDWIRTHRQELTAIGEVGLDYWKVKGEEDREIQRQIFRHFIRLSKEIDRPLNVHSRSAGRHAIAMLLEEGAQKVQLHAFDGKVSAARAGVEAGFFFSIPPSVTRSRQKQKLVRHLPLTALLAETDSPVLGPDPNSRNEPANLRRVLEAIAEIKQVSQNEVALALYRNTIRLYGNLPGNTADF